jgi:Ca-activated chloride channel family protein
VSVAHPPWLLATLAVLAALVLFWRAADRRRRAALERFAAPQLLGDLTAGLSPGRRGAKRALIATGVALAGIALAGPQYGFTWEETQRRGIDVLIALDTSRSMLAQDVAPSRLERAKLAVRDLVDKLGSDRVGLIAFAGSAFLQCPLTLDHAAFLEALDALQPGIIPAPGSDLASALHTAQAALASEARNVKLLVLFSDGEDLGGGAIAAAEQAAQQGIRVFTVGVGSDAGELIPIPGADGGTEFLKDPDGQFVKSRLDADTLRRVAEITGGFYEPLGRQGEAVAAIYERALAPLPKEELASRMRRVPIDRYQWPLALALLCLALEPLLRERRSRGTAQAGVLLVLCVLAATSAARAASPREAERLYEAGEYGKALAEYRAALEASGADPKLSFNLGAAAYRAGAYGDAAGAFAGALASDDPRLQEQGFYNLGNAQFRLGQQTRESNPQQTMQAWQQSLEAYEGALGLDPQDEDARFNRDFVKHALEELQKQQQQQQNDQQQDQQEKQDEEKKDQPQSGEQGDQNQQQSDQEQEQNQQEQQQAKQDQQKPQQKDGQSEQQDEQPPEKQQQEQQQQAKSDQGDEKQQGQPQQQAGEPPQGEQQASAPEQAPGQMSPSEARDLLDSLQDGEATLQELEASQDPQRRARARATERDW